MKTRAIFVAGMILSSCTQSAKDNSDAGSGPPPLENRCTAGTSWAPGTQAFEDVSQAWGLIGLSVEGVRISVTDIDGDGFADVSVRRVGTLTDDFGFDGVRNTWLLRNTGNRGFEDVTQTSGFTQTRYGSDANKGRPGEIVVWADVDNDGDMDAFTGMSALTASADTVESAELMINDGTGHFALGPGDSPLRKEGLVAPRSSAAFVDVNRDGFIDLWLGVGSSNANVTFSEELHLGDGAGGFTEATVDLGLTSLSHATVPQMNEGLGHVVAWSSLACDLNNDGNPELLSSSYGRAPNHLFVARRDASGSVSYSNESVASGYAYDDRMDWSDNESARCHCKLHRTDEDCANVPEPQYIQCDVDADAFRWNHPTDREPYRLGGNSGATFCADIDNDGDMDLLTSEIVHWDVGSSADPSELLINTGDPQVRFQRPGNDVTGLTRPHQVPWDDGDITGAVFDFDNDGHLDVYIASSDYPGTRGWLYWQKADGTFEAVPVDEGVDVRSSHGIAVADFDHDGDLDLLLGHNRVRCAGGDQCYPTATAHFLENKLGQGGNWVQLKLVGGEHTNKAAIGARVTVTSGELTQTQEVGGGYGHYGQQQDMVLHFGLGANCEADVTVRWPDAELTKQTFKVQTGYRYVVTQGQQPEAVR